ncbi:E2F/DP family winged-helix DNA-binding domain-containing protein [Plasmodiophora brassicae]|uniref:E2F/DP family winged-helix DNA-binding domain-containing protein n=1 Tax=Plasmodiophora brassicae TaxID=37360 RepID=A0A0G4J379_PLABS|nr:hypothetical protein PBRA_002247 [Plasmodiophora brassicae]SPQ98840.1 unnamed protein product [Plasmodiophora brassicae]
MESQADNCLKSTSILDSMSEVNLTAYKRKEKSLALLAARFLRCCPSPSGDSVIDLNAMASELGVGRRRLYDIINILETIGCATRAGKNKYTWKPDKIKQKLSRLRHVAYQQSRTEAGEMLAGYLRDGTRRSFSLGQLCERFIMFLHTEPEGMASLEAVADTLFPVQEGSDPSTWQARKSCIRRLYDVANVLTAVGVVQKVHSLQTRRPAFQWVPALQDRPRTASDCIDSAPLDRSEAPGPAALAAPNRTAKPSIGSGSAFQILNRGGRPAVLPTMIVKPTVHDNSHSQRIMAAVDDNEQRGTLLNDSQLVVEYRSALSAWMDGTATHVLRVED